MDPGKYYGYNLTIPKDLGKSAFEQLTPTAMPNGQFRSVITLYNDKDKRGGNFWFHEEAYDPSNTNEFWIFGRVKLKLILYKQFFFILSQTHNFFFSFQFNKYSQ